MPSLELKIVADADGATKVIEQLRTALNAAASGATQAGTAIDNALGGAGRSAAGAAAGVDALADSEREAANASNDVADALDETADAAGDANEEVGDLNKELTKSQDVAGKAAKSFAALFAANKMKDFAQKIFEVRKEFESLEVSFSTLLGSDAAGKEMFSELTDFATRTPLMEKDIASAAQTLLGFNIEAKNVMPILKAIGDVSMGDSQKFQSLTLAFSQMSSTGKLMGQDLLQMINAGFNPLAVISEQTGKSIGELRKEMEQGGITAQMVADAFVAATSEGGKFNGMLEKQSKTMAGAWSNMEGAIQKLENEIGTALEPVVVDFITGVTDSVNSFAEHAEKVAGYMETIGESIKYVAVAYGTYKAAAMASVAITKINAVIEAELAAMHRSNALAIGQETMAQQALNRAVALGNIAVTKLQNSIKRNGITALIALAATLAYKQYEVVEAMNETGHSMEAVNKSADESAVKYKNASKTISELTDKWNNLGDSLKEKKKFIDENKDSINELGLKLNDVNDAELLFGKRSKKIVEAYDLRAQAAGAAALAAEAYESAMRAERDAANIKTAGANFEDYTEGLFNFVSLVGAGADVGDAWSMALDQGKSRRARNAQLIHDAYMEDYNFYAKIRDNAIKQAEEIDKGLNIDTELKEDGGIELGVAKGLEKAGNLTADQIKANVEKAKEALEEAQKDLVKKAQEISDGNASAIADALVSVDNNEFTKKLGELRRQHEKTVEQITKNGEAEKEAYRDAQKKVFDAEEQLRLANMGNAAKGHVARTFSDETMSADVKKAIAKTNAEIDAFVQRATDLEEESYAKQVKEYQDEAFAGMLKSFGDYAEQRLQLERELTADLKKLEDARAAAESEGNTQMTERLDAAMKARREKASQSLKNLDFSEFQKDMGLTDMLGALDGFNTAALDKMATSLRKLIDANDDLSADGIQRVKALEEALSQIYEVRAQKNPIEALNKSLEELDAAKAAQAITEQTLAAANAVVASNGQTLEALYDAAVQSGSESALKAVLAMDTGLKDASGNVVKYGDALKANNAAMHGVSVAAKNVKTSVAACNVVWQKQQEAIGKASKAVREVGSMLDTLGRKNIASVVNMIGELADAVMQGVSDIKNVVSESTKAMTETAKIGVASLSAVEKASVILTIISTAVQVVTKIFNVAKQLRNSGIEDKIEAYDNQIDKLKQSYEDLQDVVDKTFSKDKRKAIAQENANLRKQNELIKQQIELEKQMKESEKDRDANIKEYQDRIRENEKLIAENKAAMQDAIFGEDIQAAIDKFAEAYLGAMSDGTSLKKSAKKMVAEMITGMITESMKADIAKPMQALRNKMEAMYADNVISPEERRQLEAEADRIQQQLHDKFEWADNLLKDKTGDLEGTSRGWATASQESIDELNGRFAQSQMAVQGTFEAILSGNSLVSAVNDSLAVLNSNVSSLQELAATANSYLENIESYCKRIVAAALPHFANVEYQLSKQ